MVCLFVFAFILVGFFGEQGAALPATMDAAAEDQVRIFVPVFSSTDAVGKNVSTVLGLQISQTFQASDRTGKKFGRGVLLWDDKPLKNLSHDEAFRRATDIGTLAHLVLWGTAVRYGDGVVVQSYLTVTPLVSYLERQPEKLTVVMNTPSGIRTLTLDMPAVHYNFRPRVLRKGIVDRYQTRIGLPIYADRGFTQMIGTIGHELRLLENHQDAVYLRSGKATGWVPLPEISESRSEIVSFTGAIIRILRGDWLGARELLNQTVRYDGLPQAILIDATIYKGIIEEKLGRSGLQYFQEAFELNRFNKVAAQYVILGFVSEYLRREKLAVSTKSISENMTRFFRDYQYLLGNGDSWIEDARSFVNAFK